MGASGERIANFDGGEEIAFAGVHFAAHDEIVHSGQRFVELFLVDVDLIAFGVELGANGFGLWISAAVLCL